MKNTNNLTLNMTQKDVLIIGNGFDLSCKLASSYEEFFKERYTKDFLSLFDYESFMNTGLPKVSNMEEIINEYGLVDCLLASNTQISKLETYLWADIETIILEFFEPNTISLQTLVRQYKTLINNSRRLPIFFNDYNQQNRLWSMIDNNHKEFPSDFKLEAILQLIGSRENIDFRVVPVDKIEELLLIEFNRSLHRLEHDFQKYLQKEVEKETSHYLSNTLNLFDALQLDDSNTYLISFNYTRTDTIPNCPYVKSFYEENHLHGEIGTSREIIFGIDENHIGVDSEYYSFTKTYRKLILDSIRAKPYKKLPSNVNNLIFYGHSLSDADYAYFYSIFDLYKIYNSRINIIFYYNDYLDDGSDKVLKSYTSSIVKLFNSYSKNSNFTTKNLLHKLNLEGRVQIREMKITYDGDKITNAEIVKL